MNLNPIAALSTFASKVATILPGVLVDNAKATEAIATVEEAGELARWMRKEKFMNFRGMLVPVPPGMNVYMIEHVQRLESVWSVLQDIVTGVLDPVTTQLAAFTHAKADLSVPGTFRYKDFRYPLKTVDPQDLVKKLAASYSTTALDSRPLEKVYHNAGDIESVLSRAKALHTELTKKLKKNIDRNIETIGVSVDSISESTIHASNAAEIIKMVDMASDWVELFGLFMKQTNELINAMEATSVQLKQLSESK
ncbi:hypothetical protein pEaSNUABM8_00245 [Erwinia phage pEa_SNUABM_8]|nr:hypothetical protein pEaSNUABM8_00245 [Erwinia phage pEa_SNUABM_8]QVW54997.1 hypothetical protein pEaSNUABM4_00244 [Erwinia phage pEa_SNUABM_4]